MYGKLRLGQSIRIVLCRQAEVFPTETLHPSSVYALAIYFELEGSDSSAARGVDHIESLIARGDLRVIGALEVANASREKSSVSSLFKPI